ncbi:MAG: 3-phosphoshikimate 1-carboxyvinyltransferase [Melioribacteraceae bacterium]|nr:3-phosphoshikimate 1-carboxyvinyltransferase [Melioribacteraceae bacterium]
MIQAIKRIINVKGELTLPGDKSISHRSVFFSSLANGTSRIINLLESEDILSTINCFRNLGCSIHKIDEEYIVEGKGLHGLIKPEKVLDAGNSGTTARLISGILAAQKFESKLMGDSSLSKRPMKRVVEPLREMGAVIELNNDQYLPAKYLPSKSLHPIVYEMKVASAQVKSAILLAGLHLDDETTVIEKDHTRDHTERMLNCRIEEVENKKLIHVSQKNYPVARDYVIPSDISTAAFFIVLTLLSESSELQLKDVSLNPSRTGIIEVLQSMGGLIKLENQRTVAGEELGDIIVKSSQLKNIKIDHTIIPNIIDEIPILSIAGIFAQGIFEIRGVEELRFKESDRIKSLCDNFIKLGLEVSEYEDGFSINSDIKTKPTFFESFGDHRIAMAFAVLSSLVFDESQIKDFDCVSISNPNFLQQLNYIAG